MSFDFENLVFAPNGEPHPEDYTGQDGLLYCGRCHTPKEAYFPPDRRPIFGRDRHPTDCECRKQQRQELQAAEEAQKHLDTVESLKKRGFTDPSMRN